MPRSKQTPHSFIYKPAVSLLTALALIIPLAGADSDPEIERLFTLKVKPMLVDKCVGCHGDPSNDLEGDFDLTTREGFLAGGESFDDALIPGDAEFSFVMEAVRWEDPDYEMPPKENDRLSDQQIADLERWIAAGAPWPSEERQAEIRLAEQAIDSNEEGMLIKSSGGQGDEWTYRRYQPETVWAFLPLEKPAIPKSHSDNPIDAFIAAKLSKASVEPAPKADPLTLIRRVTYDLTGLPPTPEAIDAFRKAYKRNAQSAWAELVDQLLASPRYGERWGQHWLDVARYADTGGLSNDYERSNAWRYRDYVIRSFNADKPYDQFILEQLAGDELTNESVSQRARDDKEKIRQIHAEGDYTKQETEWMIATGFLRMGPWDSAMIDKDEALQMYTDDVVNSVGQTFLSSALRCVKCHDHKFDPIPIRDYYRLYAAFSGTQIAERPAAFHPEENLEGLEEGKSMVERLHAYAVERKDAIMDKQETAARKWFSEHNLEYVGPEKRKSLPDDVKPPRHVGLDYIDAGRLKVREQDDWIWERRKERYQPMIQGVYNGPHPKNFNARKLRAPSKFNTEAEIETFILQGGSLQAPGDRVSPGVLSALGVPASERSDDPYLIPEALNGRRSAVAKWIAHPRNPLTSRSFVNRVWQYHFGKPIAANPNNLGVKGGQPTHPDLINWLASDFVENGWKLKRLHRLILLSDTYQQSSQHPNHNKLDTHDPSNDLFAYFPPRRLTAEELRDSMLAISGELNTDMGGVPVMPEINMEVALQPRMIQFSIAPAHQPNPTPQQRNRRSIYAYRVRGQADPFLELFNQPNPNDSCEARDTASVSPQAFTLLNSDVVTDRSIAFALRLEGETRTLKARTVRAFELALGRSPSSAERKRLSAYVKEMQAYHQKNEPTPKPYPTRITRSLVEEFSGKPFEYEEILPVFENYISDKKAQDVSPDTRALADLCLLLFNSNEFAYVY